MTNNNFEELKSKIARSLKNTLTSDAAAPAGEKHVNFDVHVPYHTVRLDDEEPNTATATVTYVVQCPKEKRHTVYVKFQYDKAGKFLKNTMQYV